MGLQKESTQEILSKFGRHEQDTASAEVQIALLTHRLEYLNEHLKKNRKDHHTQQGLMRMVGRRRSLLDYLKKKNQSSYKDLIATLGIRK